MRRLIPALALLALALPWAAGAYVTSATLEYSSDDEVGFWLNGRPLMAKSDFVWADFAVLSTSDGTLPLWLFNMNGDNVLAVKNYDTEGGHMGVAYRLTVHHSSGDPVVVWSEPGASKFLHLSPSQKDPQGWEKPEFDDSGWDTAMEGNISKDSQWVRWDCLRDPQFGFLGSDGCVPFVVHVASARSNGHDHNLIRSHFKFPNVPAKVRVIANPPKAAKGQAVSFKLIPGKDATYLERFQLFARVPQGLRVTSLSKGGYLDAKTNAVFWDYTKDETGVRYLTLNARSVLMADGWAQPQKVLGPPKAGKVRRQLNTPKVLFEDGAKFGPGNPGWFKTDPLPVLAPGCEITGVIIHSQLRLEGTDGIRINETDPVFMNYSVDGSMKGMLKEDVQVSHSSGGFYWIDGYHDASEDRKWSWADLANLRVKFEAKQRRLKNTNRMASLSVVVRYFQPNGIAPYFYAAVDEAQCKNVNLVAGIRQTGYPAVGSDPVPVVLNDGLCPPTPVPTSTPYPTSTPALVIAPTPEPTKAPQAPKEEAPSMAAGAKLTLGCLENAPEPFKRGGTFVWFCVDKPSDVTLIVYKVSGGAPLRTLDAGNFRPGKSQLFFNGLDDQGKALPPGQYLYEVRAKGETGQQSRNSRFSKVKDK